MSESVPSQYFPSLLDNDRTLRLRILDEIPIQFYRPTIIILFAPPEYGIEKIAELISEKVSLPIFKSTLNLTNSILTIQEFDETDNQIMLELEAELSQPKYSRGCVMFDYPTSPKQYRFLCEINNAEQIPIFFSVDPRLMNHLNNKFDRWVHSPTNRSYHLLSNPPSSNVGFGIPTESNMFDDHTGEPLNKLPEDTLESYKSRLHNYKILEFLIQGRLETPYFTVPIMATRVETYRYVLKILCEFSAQQHQAVQIQQHSKLLMNVNSAEIKRIKYMKKSSTSGCSDVNTNIKT